MTQKKATVAVRVGPVPGKNRAGRAGWNWKIEQSTPSGDRTSRTVKTKPEARVVLTQTIAARLNEGHTVDAQFIDQLGAGSRSTYHPNGDITDTKYIKGRGGAPGPRCFDIPWTSSPFAKEAHRKRKGVRKAPPKPAAQPKPSKKPGKKPAKPAAQPKDETEAARARRLGRQRWQAFMTAAQAEGLDRARSQKLWGDLKEKPTSLEAAQSLGKKLAEKAQKPKPTTARKKAGVTTKDLVASVRMVYETGDSASAEALSQKASANVRTRARKELGATSIADAIARAYNTWAQKSAVTEGGAAPTAAPVVPVAAPPAAPPVVMDEPPAAASPIISQPEAAPGAGELGQLTQLMQSLGDILTTPPPST